MQHGSGKITKPRALPKPNEYIPHYSIEEQIALNYCFRELCNPFKRGMS